MVKKKLDSEATVQTLKVVKTSYDSDCAHAVFASKEEADQVRRTLNNEPFTYEEYLEEESISCITESGQEYYRKQGRRILSIQLIPLVQWRWVFGSTNSGSMQQEELEEEKEDEVPSDAEAPEGDSEGQ